MKRVKAVADFARLGLSVARDMHRLGILFPWASAAAKRTAQLAIEQESYFLRMRALGVGYEEARDRLEEANAFARQSGWSQRNAWQLAFDKAYKDKASGA